MANVNQTITLTTAQAIVRYLAAQYIEIDGEETRLCGGGFGIFGHGNVTCLGEALHDHQDELPLYRGQNEQGMGFAAAAYAKAHLRRRFMFCTASAGPGTANLLTSAALAHANRLPMLLLCGDAFLTRLPDPVLQQLEHYGNPTFGVNDAFKAVSRYWDRITHPAQIIQSLPAALNTMLDPADCGPAFLGLPQDVQGWTYDYPASFFDKRVHRIRRQAADVAEIAEAAALLKAAKRPMIIAGGGVQYSGAVDELTRFAETHSIPVVETIAGRANLKATHALNIGPLGVTGSDSANAIAEKADVILAVGTRLQDFTTGSWTAFAQDAQIIGLNAARHDAAKHMSATVVGDAKLALNALQDALIGYVSPDDWVATAKAERAKWDDYVEGNTRLGNGPASYAQAIGVVNAACDPRDRVVAAAGGLPAEVTANWRTLDIGTVDVEFGFSCMGYEIAGGWGARIAQSEKEPDQDTIVFTGDGSYLLMNSDVYSSVLTQKKMIILVLDNGGFAVINKLQNNTGNESFNNLIADTPTATHQVGVDFEAHARSMGALAETVADPSGLAEAFARAKAADQTYVIVMKVDPYEGWTTEGHTWWEVGTPHTSENAKVTAAHKDWESSRPKQRKGV
ncbi:3D-(3,5/4)-trihydroxycyclohexane-1,2-dione acylhydrolase (decyclizing) [Octadecabacter sp. 1_MG-2023]|uniref:3D-(3,5/4)-trihydroxycyclohexane-1,2-dione acylhydrolase (decyclizing) n=1 Tax=unclassified Octadecabacter TaxID=196158 RepID=UPI001C08802D|nr:3D-(3,5/4)-trihydroxycyclohexane-1,2-dione acylhydrolase (decyclizing) [Octadecabacter sp. 1_MG-2023]MBU2994591.1 3D-(3,5/4)-trihydroxycyclohexane-1,2-dione acylhydrolase (decyclizing) [Octadecabacter sp. B2R22]MDO6734116.1 3D-(3,5/4)-trihydroxycyclohexane-1,2-dione acylhydrolase (decyclizing) [Octadecabacter sp. 1_MG-2023]